MDLRVTSTAGRWVIVATVTGSGIAMLTGTVVNVALPAIGEDLGASVSDLQWIVNGYLLTLAALILIGGSLGDRFGRRRVYLVGVVAFTIANLLCAVAPTVGWLVAARVAAGVGGALLVPGSLAILQSSFHPDDRSTAIGAWSGLTGIAVAIGPPLGGFLVDSIGWRWIFALPLPLALAVLFIAPRHVPESRDSQAAGRVDAVGGALAVVGLGGLIYPMIVASDRDLGLVDWSVGVVGLLALGGFVIAERGQRHPMLPPGVFADRQFTAANLVTFAVYGALGAVFFLLVVHLQTVVGLSATAAGAAALPVTVIMLVLSAPGGRLAQRIGPRRPLTLGPVVIAGAMLLMGGIGRDAGYWTDVFPSVVVFGLGLSLIVAPVTATALAAVPDRHSGIASGVNNAVSRAAQLIAVASLPALAGIGGADYSDPEAFGAGFSRAMAISAGVAIVGGVIAWFTISDDVLSEDAPEPTFHCGAESAPIR